MRAVIAIVIWIIGGMVILAMAAFVLLPIYIMLSFLAAFL